MCSLKNLAYLEGGPYDKWHRDTASKANNSKGDSGQISSGVSLSPVMPSPPLVTIMNRGWGDQVCCVI